MENVNNIGTKKGSIMK